MSALLSLIWVVCLRSSSSPPASLGDRSDLPQPKEAGMGGGGGLHLIALGRKSMGVGESLCQALSICPIT